MEPMSNKSQTTSTNEDASGGVYKGLLIWPTVAQAEKAEREAYSLVEVRLGAPGTKSYGYLCDPITARVILGYKYGLNVETLVATLARGNRTMGVVTAITPLRSGGEGTGMGGCCRFSPTDEAEHKKEGWQIKRVKFSEILGVVVCNMEVLKGIGEALAADSHLPFKKPEECDSDSDSDFLLEGR